MGRDKGLLDFGGDPLIVHTARLLQSLPTEVTVLGSPNRYAKFGLSAIADNPQPQGGPRLPWNLIIACDLPYLSAEWLDWLLSRAVRSRRDAVIPRTERGIEPLAAVYRRECGELIAGALAQGVRKVLNAIEKLDVEFVDWHEWRRFDPRGLVLRNMNAPRDYEEARKWWATARLSEPKHVRKPPRIQERKRQFAPRRRK
jgi:molybdopterin-guanine dinucleotide biosynthesis protein A